MSGTQAGAPAGSAELLAPAGDWECVRAAVANGADAVYFGLPRFNARLRADNFTEAELPEVVAFCHRHGVKAYVAFNTLIFTSELDGASDYLRLLNRCGVDALIVQDVGLVRLAKELVPELPIHASTQMTITSPEGVAFARDLGIERVVLARELSLRELEKFESVQMPLEVFVHGALCVAYSGQCLTSESLGQRSANRGECAQACRMPYELIVDGVRTDLRDKRYLLSPQDLAAVDEIPRLLACGVTSFKIEGRLKSPEYVAAVCQVYRRALDAALRDLAHEVTAAERYQLEMTFSRGLYSGWLHGVNHQELVSARFGKKRGPLAGRVKSVGRDFVDVQAAIELKAGDGVVFDTGGDTDSEQGGRIHRVKGERLWFGRGHIDFQRLAVGDRVWKTDDPVLNRRLRQSFTGKVTPRRRRRVDLTVRGRAGERMIVEAFCGGSGGEPITAHAHSSMLLEPARSAPLTSVRLREHLGRFGDGGLELNELTNSLEGEVILPIGELNRVRRELLYQLEAAQQITRPERQTEWRNLFESPSKRDPNQDASLTVLCRTVEQLDAALASGVKTIYADFEDIRRYAEAVALVRQRSNSAAIYLAAPRIQKVGEQGIFRLIENAAPDGVLIRNLGAIGYFRASRPRRDDRQLALIGDFSLNVANPLTAQYFIAQGLQRVTISYDLDIEQVLALLQRTPGSWFEVTVHQHMPMFHMEHCVFAAFMSQGTSSLDCGRPCEKHRVHLRDRVGVEHPLRADVGCRNTLFNAVPQSGAAFFDALVSAGVESFRVELLDETAREATRAILAYQELLSGERSGADLWRELKAHSQLGVTRGTLEQKTRPQRNGSAGSANPTSR